MNPGNYDTPITIQHYVVTGSDPVNAPIGTWETFILLIWAQKDYKSASEKERSGQIVGEGTNVFTMHYQPGITAKMRIVDNVDGNIYRITGPPLEIGRKETLIIETNIFDN